MLAASTKAGLVSERMRRPVEQLKFGRQRRDAQVRLGAREMRLERFVLIGKLRQSPERLGLICRHRQVGGQSVQLIGSGRREAAAFWHLATPFDRGHCTRAADR